MHLHTAYCVHKGKWCGWPCSEWLRSVSEMTHYVSRGTLNSTRCSLPFTCWQVFHASYTCTLCPGELHHVLSAAAPAMVHGGTLQHTSLCSGRSADTVTVCRQTPTDRSCQQPEHLHCCRRLHAYQQVTLYIIEELSVCLFVWLSVCPK